MTLIEIGIPQISGGCPYKVVNSQWVPTRPEAMTRKINKWTKHSLNVTRMPESTNSATVSKWNTLQIFRFLLMWFLVDKEAEFHDTLVSVTGWSPFIAQLEQWQIPVTPSNQLFNIKSNRLYCDYLRRIFLLYIWKINFRHQKDWLLILRHKSYVKLKHIWQISYFSV